MEIRYVTQEDIPGMARVYVDTWKAAYRGMIAQDYLESLTCAAWEERYRARHSQTEGYHVAVLEMDGEIIGVASFMRARDEDLPETCGEIVSIYVLPEYWSQGYGRMMLGWVAQELRNLGFLTCSLWTLKENLRAQRAYERFGFHRDGAEKSWEVSGVPAAEVRYRLDLAPQDQRRNEEC